MSMAKPLSPSPVSSPVNKKEKSLEEILQDVKTNLEKLREMETHDNKDCLTILKKVSQFYWKYTSSRKDIADKMAELKYSGRF
jgi:hypothetical protein